MYQRVPLHNSQTSNLVVVNVKYLNSDPIFEIRGKLPLKEQKKVSYGVNNKRDISKRHYKQNTEYTKMRTSNMVTANIKFLHFDPRFEIGWKLPYAIKVEKKVEMI